MPSNGSLIVVGTGIASRGQLTVEAVNAIREADRVFFGVPDPLTRQAIFELNDNCHTLDDLYGKHTDRRVTYEAMTERILEGVRAGLQICAVVYGHPGVFVESTHKAIERARNEGHYARMLPAVSAEDCLFADLGIDPGRTGCQTYEATKFLLYPPNFDTGIPTVIWQIGAIGVFDYSLSVEKARAGLAILSDVLASHYGESHEVVVYEASLLPICDPRIDRVSINNLRNCFTTTASTLFVPEVGQPTRSAAMAKRMGLEASS